MNYETHQTDKSHQLKRLQHARRDLAQASTVAQITSVRERAESVRSHAQRASLGIEIQNYAAELKLQAERLAGHFLTELKLRGGDRKSPRADGGLKLRDLGIDKNQSARWQLEASVPEPLFRDFVREIHSEGREISSAALLRFAKSLRDQAIDELLVQSSSAVQTVSTQSHLINGDWPTFELVGGDVDEMSALVSEVSNHHQLLTNVVQSVCVKAAIAPTSTDYRAIQRYLTEIGSHLGAITKALQRLGHSSCSIAHAAQRT